MNILNQLKNYMHAFQSKTNAEEQVDNHACSSELSDTLSLNSNTSGQIAVSPTVLPVCNIATSAPADSICPNAAPEAPAIEGGDVTYVLKPIEDDTCLYKYTSLANALFTDSDIRKGLKTIDSLNLANLSEVVSNIKLLDRTQSRLLISGMKKVQFSHEAYIDAFLANLGMLVFAHPPFLQSVCLCGVDHKRCKNHYWCPRCAYAAATQLWKEFLPHFSKGTFWFITISIKGSIPFTHINANNLRTYWSLLRTGLQLYSRVNKTAISGFYMSDEVSVRQFLPLEICPHLHGVIDATDLDDTTINELQQYINTLLELVDAPASLETSVRIRRINTQSSLKSALRYLIKPINLNPRYRMDWQRMVTTGERPAWQINNEVRDFINGVSLISHYPKSIRHIQGFGSMNAKNSEYIGVPRARRNDGWIHVKAIPLADVDWN